MKYQDLTEIENSFKVVISDTEEISEAEISDVIGAIMYEARAELRMPKDFYRSVEVENFGNVAIVSVELNLRESHSGDVESHTDDFIQKVKDRTGMNLRFVRFTPLQTHKITVETTLSLGEIKQILERQGAKVTW